MLVAGPSVWERDSVAGRGLLPAKELREPSHSTSSWDHQIFAVQSLGIFNSNYLSPLLNLCSILKPGEEWQELLSLLMGPFLDVDPAF